MFHNYDRGGRLLGLRPVLERPLLLASPNRKKAPDRLVPLNSQKNKRKTEGKTASDSERKD